MDRLTLSFLLMFFLTLTHQSGLTTAQNQMKRKKSITRVINTTQYTRIMYHSNHRKKLSAHGVGREGERRGEEGKERRGRRG